MWKEFKEFAIKGNVIDLAVGVIIGGAFSKIVASLVKDVLTPLTSLLLGKENFSHLHYKSFTYGNFIQSVIDFLIISFSIFLFVKFINHFKKKEVPAAQKIDRQEMLLAEIRDLLKEQKEITRNNETS